MDIEMDIIKTGDTAIGEYEEVLLRRDNLRKEAEQYHMAYIREFGDLITKAFEQKVECIRKKKMIAYCQRQVNMGKKNEGARLDTYIETEMAEYREELESMAKDVRAAKNSKKISPGEVMKIKKTYHGLAKKIHPDLHPELKEDERLKAYWQRIMIAYNYNQLKDLEELERLLLKLGCMKKDQGKTSGSRVAFMDPATGITLKLHDPHPQKHLKQYAINLAIEFLREIGRL